MKEERKKRRLFLAPFQPELEGAFFDFEKNKKSRDPLAPLVVLVGSNLLGLYLRRLFVQKGLNHINIRFLTFIDLARALAEEPLREDRRSPLPRFGELVGILSLAENIAEDNYFKPIADRRGFHRTLAATFQDLGDGGIEELPVQEDKKLVELGHLYRAYRFMIGKDFYNDTEVLLRASKAVQKFFRVFASEELTFYGFYDFTESQKRLLKACTDQLEVAAFMPWRESTGFVYASSILQWYKELGFEVMALEKFNKEKKKSLAVLQQDLFRERARGPQVLADHNVLFISAPNEAQEVREIARESLRLAREENINFHEMAILLRNADFYGPLILETFQRLEIPLYFQRGISLLRTPAGKSSILLLDLIGSNLKRSEVMEFLTFAPIAWSRFFQEIPSPSQWDLISREAGIVEGRKQWEERLNALMSRRKEEESAEGEDEAPVFPDETRRFWDFLKEFFSALDRFPRKGTWQGMVNASIHFMRTYFEKSETQEAIFDCLRELESLDTFGRDVEIRRFKEIVSADLEENGQRLGGFQREGICVTDLMPARGLSFRVVFIPGLVERVFPAPARQDPLLLDHERRLINDALGGKGRIPLKRFRSQEEKLLFTLAVGSAREKLILSYPRLDPSSGRERIPSFFLLRVAEALHGEAMDYSRLETLPEFRRVALSRLAPDDGEQAIDEGEFDLCQVTGALKRNDRREVAYLKSLFPVLQRAERLARLRWGFRTFTEYDGCLKSLQALHLLRERFALFGQVLAPTRLETYASCPFKYFLSEVLGLRVLPSPEEILRIRPLERGKVVHDLLFRFYREAIERIPGPFRLDQIATYGKVLADVADRVFSEAEAEGFTGAPLLWEIDRQEILEDLRVVLKRTCEESPEWIPTHFEVRFGYQSPSSKAPRSPEAISLTLEGQSTVSFRGRIDRVDFSPDGSRLRVIDYKTGIVEGQPDGFGGGTALQLPLYLLASCRIWSRVDIEKSWAEYDSVSRKGKFKRLFFNGKHWTEKENTLKKIIQIISRGILEGTFFPCRQEDRSCDPCDFKTLCEQGTSTLFQRKRNDPRAAAFLEMREIP
jgi:ATP-dependent helicase/nuclease subunit B